MVKRSSSTREKWQRDAQDGNAGGPGPPHAEQMARFTRPIGAEIGPQQGELDQVMLRTAAANTFVLPGERRKRLDRSGKIAAFERREAARQGGKVRARRITPLSRQRLDLASARVERGLVAHDG